MSSVISADWVLPIEGPPLHHGAVAIEDGRISVELRIPGGDGQSLGDYPRDWPEEISARHSDPFVRPQRGVTLVEDDR